MRVRVVDLDSGKDEEVPADRSRLSAYRHSSIGPCDVVVWAEFALRRGDAAEAEEEVARRSCAGVGRISPVVRTPGRCSPTPPATRPAGSSTQAGLKGFRVGTARVSEKHANFIQADDGGSADDVLRLMREVVGSGAGAFGVRLQAGGAPRGVPQRRPRAWDES